MSMFFFYKKNYSPIVRLYFCDENKKLLCRLTKCNPVSQCTKLAKGNCAHV